MAPVTEIALLPLVEGKYPDDANSGPGQTWKGLLDTLLSQKGVQKVYWGREIENPSTLRLFVDWDSLDGHKTFIASEAYKPFFEGLGTLLSGPPALYHAHFDPHPPPAALTDSSSLATETITLYFPPSYSSEDQKEVETNVQKLIDVIAKHADGYKASVGGWVEEELPLPGESEKAKAYVGLIAWVSVEAHLRFRETQVFKDNIHFLRGAKDLKTVRMVHVSFKEVKSGSGGASW